MIKKFALPLFALTLAHPAFSGEVNLAMIPPQEPHQKYNDAVNVGARFILEETKSSGTYTLPIQNDFPHFFNEAPKSYSTLIDGTEKAYGISPEKLVEYLEQHDNGLKLTLQKDKTTLETQALIFSELAAGHNVLVALKTSDESIQNYVQQNVRDLIDETFEIPVFQWGMIISYSAEKGEFLYANADQKVESIQVAQLDAAMNWSHHPSFTEGSFQTVHAKLQGASLSSPELKDLASLVQDLKSRSKNVVITVAHPESLPAAEPKLIQKLETEFNKIVKILEDTGSRVVKHIENYTSGPEAHKLIDDKNKAIDDAKKKIDELANSKEVKDAMQTKNDALKDAGNAVQKAGDQIAQAWNKVF